MCYVTFDKSAETLQAEFSEEDMHSFTCSYRVHTPVQGKECELAAADKLYLSLHHSAWCSCQCRSTGALTGNCVLLKKFCSTLNTPHPHKKLLKGQFLPMAG